MKRLALCVAISLIALTTARPLRAQTDEISKDYLTTPEAAPKKAEEGKKESQPKGWIPRLSLGAGLSLVTSDNVVGQLDGVTVTGTFQGDGGIDFRRGSHEWRNSLKISEAFSRTPAIDKFVKSTDIFALDSLYLYRIKRLPWFGPFAQATLQTAMLEGRDVRGSEVNYLISDTDGTTRTVTDNELRLSDPFQPLTLRESIGAFADLIQRTRLNLLVKLGFGAQHTFAAGQLAVNDDGATDTIEVKELRNAHQGGPVLDVEIRGSFPERKISYFLGGEMLIPVINDDSEDRSAIKLTNMLFEAGLSVKIVSWASLDYQFRALREPQIIDVFQVQNNLLLTFTWSVVEPPKKDS